MHVNKSLIALLSVAAAVCGVHAGTIDMPYWYASPSVRANGMGQAGVALIDAEAAYFNPGAIGFGAGDARLQTSYVRADVPDGYGLITDFSYVGVVSAVPLRLSRANVWRFGLAYYRVGATMSSTYTTPPGIGPADVSQGSSEAIGLGTVAVGRHSSDNIGLGVLYARRIQVGFGLTAKILSVDSRGISVTDQGGLSVEQFPRTEARALALDAGLLVRMPLRNGGSNATAGRSWLRVVATTAISTNNLGPRPSGHYDDSLAWSDFELSRYPIREGGPGYTQSELRFGMTTEIALCRHLLGREVPLASLLPSIELDFPFCGRDLHKAGLEVGLAGAITLRGGLIHGLGDGNERTFGCGLSSSGLVRAYGWLSGRSGAPGRSFFRDRLDVQVSYATYSAEPANSLAGAKFYGVTVSFR
jgi:hypothetical protein